MGGAWRKVGKRSEMSSWMLNESATSKSDGRCTAMMEDVEEQEME